MMKLHKTIAYMLGFAGLVLASTASAAVVPAMTNSPYLPGTLTSTSVTITGYYNNSPTTVYFDYGTTASFGSQTPAVTVSNITGPMSVSITGLNPSTTYYYRSVGTNSAGTGYGSPTRTFTTTAAAAAPATPSITSIYANNVSQTSATLYGAVNANGASGVTATITYNGNTVISQAVTGTSSTTIQYALGGLTAGTSYSFSVCATGISCQTVSFTTLSNNQGNNNGNSNYTAPSVTTYSATNTSTTSATLNGYIAPNSSNYINRYFQYGTNQYSLVMATQSASISSPSSVSDTVYNLQPNTTYYFRAVAQDSGYNIIYGSILSFYTGNNNGNNGNGQANVTTNNATNANNTSAVLNGYIISNGASVNRYFQYSTNQASINTNTTSSVYFGNTSGSVSDTVYNLQPNTTYYFRLVTQDNSTYNLSYGSILSFSTGTGSNGTTTLSAITTDATFQTSSSLKLNGLATNNSGYSATGYFEYGTSAFSLTKSTAVQNLGTTSSTSFSDVVYNLEANSALYYRAVVQNSNGSITRGDVLFGKTTATGTTAPVDTTTPTNATSGARVRNAYIELGINTPSETVSIGNNIDYTLFYKNITATKTIKNVVVRVILPKAVKLNTTSAGKLNEADNTVTIDVGTLVPGQEATVSMQGSITRDANPGDLIVTTTSIVYTDAVTGNQGNAIAYISNRVNSNNNNLLGAALFGTGFFPSTFVGWLILILLIMGLVYFARKFYRQNEAHHPGHVEKAPAHN